MSRWPTVSAIGSFGSSSSPTSSCHGPNLYRKRFSSTSPPPTNNRRDGRAGRQSNRPDAMELWEAMYPKLREDRPGLEGAITARGSAVVLRLSLIYALLDGKLKKVPLFGRNTWKPPWPSGDTARSRPASSSTARPATSCATSCSNYSVRDR